MIFRQKDKKNIYNPAKKSDRAFKGLAAVRYEN